MATTLTQAVHQNLECPVCLSFFKDPKILTCSHTFCKGCLETLLESLPGGQSLSCPVCRGVSPVPEGDVSKLQTSIALRSLTEDVETQGQLCANCDSEDRIHAVAFCKDCGEFLCGSCKTTHSKWKKFSGHSVVPAHDVFSGKIPLKRRYKCQKHPSEDEECYCFTCNVYVCFRCGVLDHSHEGHKIAEATVHENEQKKSINELASKAEEKNDAANQFIACVAEEREKLQKVQKKISDDIDEAYEDSVRKLSERREALKNEVCQQVAKLEALFASMEDETRDQVSKVNAICALVKNGLRVPLQKEALTAHTTLCKELEQLLGRVEPDREQLKHTRKQSERLGFKRSKDSAGLEIGQIPRWKSKWVLHTEQQLPTEDSMSGMAASPDNTMSVGSWKGGIFKYSPDGHLQQTVIENVKVQKLQYFSDGRYMVRDTSNHVTLYSPQHQDLGVKFTTLTYEEGGFGDVTIDKDGHVLTSYTKAKKIQLFRPGGGKAVTEKLCNEYEPWQIFAMTSSPRLVASNVVTKTVHLIDGISGSIIHSVSKEDTYAYPCVGKDDSVIIAWVKHDEGMVNIDLYTQQLQFKKTLISDFNIIKPERWWYYLQIFKSGEMAFCTPDRLYIFKEMME